MVLPLAVDKYSRRARGIVREREWDQNMLQAGLEPALSHMSTTAIKKKLWWCFLLVAIVFAPRDSPEASHILFCVLCGQEVVTLSGNRPSQRMPAGTLGSPPRENPNSLFPSITIFFPINKYLCFNLH